MKILVTGYNGQLGFDVVKRLKSINIECLGVDRNDFDLVDELKTKEFIKNYNPDVVVHCGAYTAVDKAEEEREMCYKVNVLGTRYVAQACANIDAKMVYISTDYVFDGEGEKPFEVTDEPRPINYYGKTKYEGELEVKKYLDKAFIIRVSWVFGINGNNFVKTMLKLGKEKEQLNVVADQIGSPTYAYDLANLISEMIFTEKYGTYHATNEGYCSWYEFACEIFNLAGINVAVNPIRTEDYPTKVLRPKNSRLSKKSLELGGFDKLPDWKDGLKRYIDELRLVSNNGV
jgi:dTDP-4-dehydrorhamnose reductase